MLVTPLVLIQIFSKRMLVDWPKCGSDPRDEGHLACLWCQVNREWPHGEQCLTKNVEFLLASQQEDWKQEYLQGSIDTVGCSQYEGWVNVKRELLRSDTTPYMSTVCLPDITIRDRIFQAFPLHNCK